MVPTLRLSAALAGALLLIVLLPSGAAAKGFELVELEARGKADGHAFGISAVGVRERVFSYMQIRPDSLAQPGQPRISSFYIPPRQRGTLVSAKRFRIKLGERGSANLRFRPGRTRVTRVGTCGGEIVRSRGTLVGHLRFRGERGYVHLDEQRVKARQNVFRFPRGRRCARRPAPERPAPVLLGACNERGLFAARTFESGRTNYVVMSPFRVREGLFTTSLGRVVGAPGEFTYSSDLSSATVTPPSPFKGIGSFSEGTLEGDLRFNLPASGRSSLAGARAELVRAERVNCGDYELPGLPRAEAGAARQLLAREVPWFRPFG